MCVKLSPRDLNPGLCPLNAISTYTYGVIIAPMVCGGWKNWLVSNGLEVAFNRFEIIYLDLKSNNLYK